MHITVFFFLLLRSSLFCSLFVVLLISVGVRAKEGRQGSWADRGGSSAYERRETCVSCSSFPSFPLCVCVLLVYVRVRERRKTDVQSATYGTVRDRGNCCGWWRCRKTRPSARLSVERRALEAIEKHKKLKQKKMEWNLRGKRLPFSFGAGPCFLASSVRWIAQLPIRWIVHVPLLYIHFLPLLYTSVYIV